MDEPHMTNYGLFFNLQCDHSQRNFIISIAALHTLRQHYGFMMNDINLYRAHEAIIHAVARFRASQDISVLPIMLEPSDFQLSPTDS